MIKKLIAPTCVSIVLVATCISPVAHGAQRPTNVPGCAAVTAKSHTPMKVTQPTSIVKSLPKTMTIVTNCGSIVISLLAKQAPITVSNITTLAKAKYFNASLCHRLTTEGLYVLQCGDPTASGSGSPTGWKGYKDENLPANKAANYPAGTVAMANSGVGTNGSQFFLVYKDTQLPPNYTIWGKITSGLDFLVKLSEVGSYTVNQSDGKAYYATDGYPIQSVEIKSVTLH